MGQKKAQKKIENMLKWMKTKMQHTKIYVMILKYS